MWSVTVTDIIQFVVMTVGIFAIMLPMSIAKADGIGSLISKLPESHLSLTSIGYAQIFQYFLLFMGMVVSQDIWQRVFTAKSPSIARKGSLYAGIYSIAYALAGSIIGMCAFVILPNIGDTQNTFATLALNILPAGILGTGAGERHFCAYVHRVRNAFGLFHPDHQRYSPSVFYEGYQ